MEVKNKFFQTSTVRISPLWYLPIIICLVFTIIGTNDSYGYTTSSVSSTISTGEGPQTVSFRDVLDLNPGDPPATITMSLDKRFYSNGDTAILTITFSSPANLDHTKVDTIIADVNTSIDPTILPVELTETGGIDTGVFTGSFTFTNGPTGGNSLHLEGKIQVTYEPPPEYTARFEMILDGITSGGTVVISDEPSTTDDDVNNGIGTIIDSIRVDFIGAAVDTDPLVGSAIIKLSWSNAIMTDLITYPESEICLLHQSTPGGPFIILTTESSTDIGGPNDLAHDGVTQTVTNVGFPTETLADFHPEGRYVLAFCTGGPGGGAGGLVRPGLVLNFLAGAFGDPGGRDTTPPSLTRPISSGVQFDPFTPIESGLTSPAGTTQEAPLRINGNDYPLYGYSNTIVKNTIETGQFTDMSLAFEEASKVEHVAMYFVDQGSDEYSDTDPALIFDKGNIAKEDPEGIFGDDIQLSTSKEGTKSIFNFGVSFDKPTNKNLMIVAWDDKRNSGVTKIFNAIEVVGNAIPNEVAHFMPIEALGEFELVKNDNGQYVLSEPVKIQTVTSDSPKSTVYPEFIGRLERHDLRQLYDAISNEQQKASDLMVGKFNLDTSHRFVADDEVKPYDMSRRASELTQCGNNIGCGLDRENKEIIQKLLWQEHLKAEKMLKSLLVGSKYHQD